MKNAYEKRNVEQSIEAHLLTGLLTHSLHLLIRLTLTYWTCGICRAKFHLLLVFIFFFSVFLFFFCAFCGKMQIACNFFAPLKKEMQCPSRMQGVVAASSVRQYKPSYRSPYNSRSDRQL